LHFIAILKSVAFGFQADFCPSYSLQFSWDSGSIIINMNMILSKDHVGNSCWNRVATGLLSLLSKNRNSHLVSSRSGIWSNYNILYWWNIAVLVYQCWRSVIDSHW